MECYISLVLFQIADMSYKYTGSTEGIAYDFLAAHQFLGFKKRR